MNMYLRMLLMWLRRGSRPPLASTLDVARLSFRVGLADLDVLGHMNNGRYLTSADLGRVDLMQRNGVWKRLKKLGWYPVVAAQTITYRKSLELGVRFEIESRFIGVDDSNIYLEQRWVVKGEVYARAIIRGRLISKTNGPLRGEALTREFPEYAERPNELISYWAEATALPSTRRETPSVWPWPDPPTPEESRALGGRD